MSANLFSWLFAEMCAATTHITMIIGASIAIVVSKSAIASAVLLIPADVAATLGVRVSTLAKWRCTGAHHGPRKLRFLKLGNCVRYDAESVDEFIAGMARHSSTTSVTQSAPPVPAAHAAENDAPSNGRTD